MKKLVLVLCAGNPRGNKAGTDRLLVLAAQLVRSTQKDGFLEMIPNVDLWPPHLYAHTHTSVDPCAKVCMHTHICTHTNTRAPVSGFELLC